MPGIGVITNPRSGRNRRNPGLARQLAYVLGEQGQLAAPDDLEALHRVAEHFRERRIDILAINGGDGTNHVVLTAMRRVYGDEPLPRIALLRGGTMNTVASGLGIRGRPEVLLGRLVAAYHAGEPLAVVRRNLLEVEGQVGFLFGNGVISRFLEIYYEGSPPSPWKAARLLLQGIASVLVGGKLARRLTAHVRCRVTLDGELWDRPSWLAVAAGTVDDIGLRFRPFRRVPFHPDTLEVVGAACSLTALAGQLPRFRFALPPSHPDILDGLGRELVLEADEPQSYMVDGDFHRGGQRLVVRVGPRVEIVRP